MHSLPTESDSDTRFRSRFAAERSPILTEIDVYVRKVVELRTRLNTFTDINQLPTELLAEALCGLCPRSLSIDDLRSHIQTDTSPLDQTCSRLSTLAGGRSWNPTLLEPCPCSAARDIIRSPPIIKKFASLHRRRGSFLPIRSTVK